VKASSIVDLNQASFDLRGCKDEGRIGCRKGSIIIESKLLIDLTAPPLETSHALKRGLESLKTPQELSIRIYFQYGVHFPE